MEISQEVFDAFDRKLRSYITAMLLQDEKDMVSIIKQLEPYKNDEGFIVMMLASYGAMTAHLMSLMIDEPTNESVFDLWTEISSTIELEAILGDEL